jgi:hypothetical protein
LGGVALAVSVAEENITSLDYIRYIISCWI